MCQRITFLGLQFSSFGRICFLKCLRPISLFYFYLCSGVCDLIVRFVSCFLYTWIVFFIMEENEREWKRMGENGREWCTMNKDILLLNWMLSWFVDYFICWSVKQHQSLVTCRSYTVSLTLHIIWARLKDIIIRVAYKSV